MKKLLISFSSVSAALVLLLSSCSKKIEEAYVNPNADVRVPIETLLPGIIGNFVGSSAAAGSAYGVANDGLYVGRYIQYWGTNISANQYDQMGGATGASDVLGSIWAMHYFGMGGNLNKMIEWGIEEKKWDYVGVGYAIRAWSWLMMTDTYGEAILQDAFRPDLLVFRYDSQAEIYAEARRTAHLAIQYLSMTGDGVSQANLNLGDAYFYNGDVNKWKKFAYSVLARSFNHLTNKISYQPDSVIYYANLGIINNADNATAKFANTGITGTSNFYGPVRGNANALRQTKFVADLMNGSNPMFLGVVDPRIAYYIRKNTNNTYKGIVPGLGGAGAGLALGDSALNYWGGPFTSVTAPPNDNNGRYIFRNGSPFPIITASEVHFMKAEAYLRKGLPTEARVSYIAGITTSIDFLTGTPDYHNSVPAAEQITGASKAAFLADPLVVPATITRSHIMLQKYLAMYGWGLVETWVDMRRYHYTDLDPVTGIQVYANFVPPSGSNLFTSNLTKLVYRARPRYNSEFLYNIAALDGVGGRLLDYNTKEMWFSQQ